MFIHITYSCCITVYYFMYYCYSYVESICSGVLHIVVMSAVIFLHLYTETVENVWNYEILLSSL